MQGVISAFFFYKGQGVTKNGQGATPCKNGLGRTLVSFEMYLLKKSHMVASNNSGSSVNLTTVVAAFGDPRRERPPALYGHVINAPTDTFQR